MNRHLAALAGLGFCVYLLHGAPALAGAESEGDDGADAAEVADANNVVAEDGASPCVEAEVNGVRAQSFSCLTEKLKPKAAAAQARAGNNVPVSERVLQLPGNQLGLFNLGTMSNRMGNTLGTSVYPQRPPANTR